MAIALAAVLTALPACAASRDLVSATITAAARRTLDAYVDVVDPRALFTNGLRGLERLEGATAPARRRALDEAIRAEAEAIGFKPQAEVLIGAIARLRAGGEREAALAAALRGMAEGLDKNSRYISTGEMAPPPGSVGLEITASGGVFTVVRPLPGSPGESAGVRAGDAIVAINGRALAGLRLTDVVNLLRGPLGVPVTLGIARQDAARDMSIKVVRGPVRAASPLTLTVVDRIAVIKLTAFNARTAADVKTALDDAKTRAAGPLAGLVLDLRRNAGGLLDAAEALGALLLPRDVAIARLRGRSAADNRMMTSGSGDVTGGLPIAVLVDDQTGAGAEIVAVALQDHGRALILGKKTAGAGTIQTVLPLPPGTGALAVTTARVYRPTGAALDGAGVVPDIAINPETRAVTSGGRPDAQTHAELVSRIASDAAPAPPGVDFETGTAIRALERAEPQRAP